MNRDTLFLLQAPFEDGKDQFWFCQHCAMLEGALLANPHWAAAVDVKRVAFPRPRAEVIALLDEAHQWLPVLVLGEGEQEPPGAKQVNGRAVLYEPAAIAAHLAARHGGAGPHP